MEPTPTEPIATEPTIRPATLADAPAIAALVLAIAPAFFDPDAEPGAQDPFLESITPEALAENLAADAYRYHVAYQDDALVGVVGTRGDTHLLHLFIASDSQRRGLGTRLWTLARDACRAAGNPGRFTVNAAAHAVPFYEHLGFVPAGEMVREHGLRFLPMLLTMESCGKIPR